VFSYICRQNYEKEAKGQRLFGSFCFLRLHLFIKGDVLKLCKHAYADVAFLLFICIFAASYGYAGVSPAVAVSETFSVPVQSSEITVVI
jgi:hypothetical protein